MPSTAGLLSSEAVSRRATFSGVGQERPDALTEFGRIERGELFGTVGEHDRASFTGQIWPVIKCLSMLVRDKRSDAGTGRPGWTSRIL